MDTFTPTDSDLVFRRKERYILLGVLIFDALVFAAVLAFVFKGKENEALVLGGLMVLALAGLGLLTAWLWTFEVRFTPYEVVVRSCFGSKVVQYSNISTVRRERVQGKTPAQYQLRLSTADDQRLTLPDIASLDTSVFAELRNRCRNAEVTD